MGKMTELRVVRIDPDRRTIATIKIDAPRNEKALLREVKRVVRAETIGHREILPEEEGRCAIIIAGGLAVDETSRGFRLRGCEDHAGIGILFGKGPGGGMTDSPVDTRWVERRIVWLDGEDPVALQARAESTADLLVPELRDAMLGAVDGGPFAAGDSVMWVKVDDKLLFPALLQLGLTDEPTKGQRLTRLGDRVLAVLNGGE